MSYEHILLFRNQTYTTYGKNLLHHPKKLITIYHIVFDLVFDVSSLDQ